MLRRPGQAPLRQHKPRQRRLPSASATPRVRDVLECMIKSCPLLNLRRQYTDTTNSPMDISTSPLRRRLWLGGCGVGLALLTIIIANAMLPRDHAVSSSMLGHDFMAFYTAGTFLRTGQLDSIYDLPTVRNFQHDLARKENLEIGPSFGPFWNPPFYAWVFVPLSMLPYGWALGVWVGVGVGCLIGAMVLLVRILKSADCPSVLPAEQAYELRLCPEDAPRTGFATWGLVPLLIIVSSPFLQALNHGQNTFTSLLILTCTVVAWRARRAVLAGVILGLMFYKPQHAAVISLVLVIDLGWRAIVGLCITGGALLATTLLTMPGLVGQYLHRLPANLRFMQVENVYLWERHVTLRGFWRLLLQGRDVGETSLLVTLLAGACAIGVAGLLAWAWWTTRQRADDAVNPAVRTDRLIAATLAATPLIMPFYFDYDLLLLAIPAVLTGRQIRLALLETPRLPSTDRWLVATWAALFVWAFANAGTGQHFRINLTVPLLCGVAILLIARLRATPRLALPAAQSRPVPIAKAA